MRTTKELNETIGASAVAAAGSVRRMAVTLTGTTTIAKLQWQMTGVRMLDNKPEIVNVEVFGGIGIAARPPTSGKPEAIVIGPADGAVAIAVRDAKTQVQIAGALKPNETMLFNSVAAVHVTDAGKVEVRAANGVALPLPTMADVEAMVAKYNGHTHNGTVGAPVAAEQMPDPTGTTVLKGQ